jgi:hypothetical protein
MNEFAELEGRDPKGAERVTNLVSHLLRHQFIHLDDRGSPGLLETLHRPPLRRLAEAWFDVAGYRLVFNETEGWAGILPDVERISLPRMRLDDTIILLLLRRLWEEKIQTGMIVGRGAVLLTFNEAYVAYGELVGGGRRPALAVNGFRDALGTFSRKALIELGPYDDEQQDQELTIRPIVAVVAGDAFVANLEALIAKVELGEPDAPADDEQDDETDEEAA